MRDLALPRHWLDRLFREEQGRLQRRLGRWLGCPAAAEDVLQDSFLRLAGSQAATEARDPAAYLARAARHAAADRLRGPAGRPSGQASLTEDLACPGPLPDAVAEQRERVRRFATALRALPAQQRAMVVAARLEGQSHAAIAARHGTTPAAVEKAVARALLRLSACLDEADDSAASR
ncbi:RNA polymerase sigma factor [Roseomonas sp. 18066]|uniref:RNA polymerase sigma factor n=1 Tax=Roseomonas sp. 18066 TaxID=2681412 RepID=UPI00135AA0EC|nr:sigma-70 family RNA polymerase sigma factor [Roseomonas sp. 18066]